MTFPGTIKTRISSHIPFILFVSLVIATCLAFPFAAKADAESYRLAGGDTVSFDFLDDAELPVTLTIASDGDTQFPLIGSVNILGLTVNEALQKLRNEYRQRQMLTDPKLALHVSAFRPVFVLGEVKTPGSFPFYPGLTVEQAIGLAGGPQTLTSNPSDRILLRARLRGEMDGAEVEIVSEALYAARLVAQLKGSDKIDLKDAPEIARPYLEHASLKGAIEIEERILKTDLITTDSQVQILTQGITETEEELKILAQLEEQQKEVVAMNEKDLDRVTALRKRELNTEADLSRTKTTTSNEKSRLLEVYAGMSNSRRELGKLKLDLAKLKADRETDILVKLQEREVAIKKLEAARQTAQEQFFLIASIATDEKKRNQISFTYEIRRVEDKGHETIEASISTELLPGDVLAVSIAGM
ncbi:polysaccharide export protein [Rhizobium sp. LjRoot98]|uniref:polysaccharide biosynthesis/export family protein n=1 Tax=unclassified Rhizobium TaxID=2613769 RepID=UPI0007141959|nr:polysaccharide biosynthesis/export family protein [Rhizobium sp. Root1204]KQV38699.1 sugar ABC transporter substrate-binding protein [Rhizobium sp. Root1204]